MIPMLSLYILEIFEGDIVMDNDLRNAVLGKKRSAVFAAEVGQKKHWPNGRVPFLIDSSLSMFFFSYGTLTFLNVLNGGITILLVHISTVT